MVIIQLNTALGYYTQIHESNSRFQLLKHTYCHKFDMSLLG